MSFINSILNVFVGSKSKKDIKEVEGIVKDILKYEEKFSKLSHNELRYGHRLRKFIPHHEKIRICDDCRR